MLSKEFFARHANEHVKKRIRQMVRPYPDDDVFQENFQIKEDWNLYKKVLLNDVTSQIKSEKELWEMYQSWFWVSLQVNLFTWYISQCLTAWDNLWVPVCLTLNCVPSEKGSMLKGKKLLLRRKFFLFSEDPHVQGRRTFFHWVVPLQV